MVRARRRSRRRRLRRSGADDTQEPIGRDLRRAAGREAARREAEITIAVEIIFPTWLLLKCLDRFGQEAPHTRLEVIETVIGGAPEALLERRVDLALTPRVPPGFSGESLMRLAFVPAAHPNHPLFQLGRRLTLKDLRKHRNLIVRDTSVKRDKRGGYLEAEQRWTVGHMATSLQAARMGLGFAWYPKEKIREEIAAGELEVLPLEDGGDVFAEIYLVLADPEGTGPGVRRLAEILKQDMRSQCASRPHEGTRTTTRSPRVDKNLPQKARRPDA